MAPDRATYTYTSVLAALVVEGPSLAATDARAVQLGALQQARIESPSPYTAAERNDSMVALDDPRLRVPVYWLGSTFAPHHGFPAAIPLFAIDGRGLPEESSDVDLAILYSRNLVLGTWTRSAWSAFRRAPSARREWTWHCTRSRDVKLRRGRAVVYATYAKDYKRCPQRPPRHYFAHVFVDNVMIGINQTLCNDQTGCEPYFSRGYNSFRGMVTVARGLRLRPQRTG